MASVTIRIDDGKRDELEELARSRGKTVSDLLREAIDRLLARDVPSSLDMVARRSLALSHAILEILAQDPDARSEHRRSIEVPSNGYTSEYYREFYSFDAELPPDDAPLVMDILDMFAAVEAGLGGLGADAELGGDARQALEFTGFDHQHPRESRLAGFAEHLIAEGRWDGLAHHFGTRRDRPRCPNSHAPTLGRYRRMVEAFAEVMDTRRAADRLRGAGGLRDGLTVDELDRIAGASRSDDSVG